MSLMREVHLIGGTRPEAVKLAPVAIAMREAGLLQPVLLASGQHPTMVTQALAAFGLEPDITLEVERSTGTQAELLTAMVRELDELWSVRTPAAVIVQGDTTTSLAGALAAFWRRIPVVHLEAVCAPVTWTRRSPRRRTAAWSPRSPRCTWRRRRWPR